MLTLSKSLNIKTIAAAIALASRCVLVLQAGIRSTLEGGIETVEKLAAAGGTSTGLSLLTGSGWKAMRQSFHSGSSYRRHHYCALT